MFLLECCVCLLLQCIILTGAQGEEIDCQNTAYGRSCALPNAPERTALIGDRLYVGITNELLAFQLRDLQLVDQIDLSPSVNRSNICEFDQLNDRVLCENYIRVIQLIPETAPAQRNKLLVCGTNAFFPKCRLHDPTDLSNWIFMTAEELHSDDGFAPFANTRPNVGVLASNGRFFSGTFFSAYGSERAIGMAPRPLERDSTFTLRTPSSNTRWLHRPDFVSVYEHGDHVYFFAREPAYEVDMGRTVAYSRAIRLCKNDDGTTDQTQMTFLTFQKARITCRNNGGTNTIPYNYDNLKATYLWQSDNGEQILYGAFSAPEFGPEGTAICKFSFNDIARVFEDGLYLIPSAEDNNVWVRATPGSFSCPGTSGDQRTDEHAADFQLVFNTINAMQPEPLHVVSGEEVTQIAVDFINYGGVENEILYYSTSRDDTGVEIRQLVIAGSESYEHTILDISAMNAIRSLDVYQGDNEIRHLFLTTENSVLSIPRGDCSRYTDCFSCLDSKDPYCGWDTASTPNCVNKLLTSNSLIESVSSTENMITEACGPRPPTTPTQPPPLVPSACPNTAPTSTETDSRPTGTTGTSDGPPANGCTPSVGELDTSESDDSQLNFSIPELVGSTVGGLVVGILIGLLVCGVFFKLFVKRNDSKSAGSGGGNVRLENGSGPVNNQLNVLNVQKKEQNHYVDTQPMPHATTEEQPEKKDLNRYESPEEDDAIAPLSSRFQQNGSRSNRSSRSPPKPRPKPPRSRTESTRELMGSVSSEPSDSVEFSSSPLDSPV